MFVFFLSVPESLFVVFFDHFSREVQQDASPHTTLHGESSMP